MMPRERVDEMDEGQGRSDEEQLNGFLWADEGVEGRIFTFVRFDTRRDRMV